MENTNQLASIQGLTATEQAYEIGQKELSVITEGVHYHYLEMTKIIN